MRCSAPWRPTIKSPRGGDPLDMDGMTEEPANVLVIEDDANLRRVLRTTLAAQNFTVIEADRGRSALDVMGRERFDLVVLDLILPDIDGLEVLRQIRAHSKVPVVVLSARSAEKMIVEALELGADDYVTKPFSYRELLARLRSARRHAFRTQDEPQVFRSGALEVDLEMRQVMVAGRNVQLSPTEFALLRYLVLNAGKVVLHHQILHAVWNDERNLAFLRVYIRQLRRKIEPDPEHPVYIVTASRNGYRLQVDE